MKNDIAIMDLISMEVSDFDKEYYSKIDDDPEYRKAAQKLEDEIKTLEKQKYLDIDAKINYAEVLARDIAFNEGFKLGVRLIISSLK